MVIRVAVIGCGASGLCALRHLTSRPDEFEAVGFEQLSQVGGTWIYTDAVGHHDNGLPVQSSMYKNLRTNLPKETMAFPAFPFPDNLPSYIRHEDVLKYLQSYCNYYNLSQCIKFETKVDLVEPLDTCPPIQWKVSYSPVQDPGVQDTIIVDAVMVCNGHYEVPLIPDILGMDEFRGAIIHSHDYRVPDGYRNKIVVLLGAMSSGQDIGLDIATVANKVMISHNKTPLETVLPNNVFQKPGIARMGKHSVVFNNGEEENIDAIILCTGYRYNFPFLNTRCCPTIEDERLTPMYKHIIHAEFPTLAVIGICKFICPFPQFDCQVQYFLSTLNGCHTLPTKEDMINEIEEDFETRRKEGLPPRYAHTMADRQWTYHDELARLGRFKPLPRVLQTLFDEVIRKRIKDIDGYKDLNYALVDEDKFIEV